MMINTSQIIIKVKTEKQLKLITKIFQKYNVVFVDNMSFKKINHWDVYKENTYYRWVLTENFLSFGPIRLINEVYCHDKSYTIYENVEQAMGDIPLLIYRYAK